MILVYSTCCLAALVLMIYLLKKHSPDVKVVKAPNRPVINKTEPILYHHDFDECDWMDDSHIGQIVDGGA